MERVVGVCGALGYSDVWTYANSGNVVFTTTGRREAIERALQDSFEEQFGFEVTTFVRTARELQKLVDNVPFRVADGDTHFVTFLKEPADGPTAAALEAASNEFDTLVVNGRDVHWRMRGKSTDTRLGASTWDVVGKKASTSRNVTLLRRIVAKLDG